MANQPSKYSKFLVGAASAALVASAVAPVASAADFKDTKGNTHEEAINALSDAGVIKGYSDGTFLPNKTLTRSDVVKMMGKWLVTEGHSIPADARTNPRFTDLSTKTNAELLDYAAVVKDAGVFIGSDGKLLATDNITRENMALVLVRAFDTVNEINLVEYVNAQEFTKDVKDLSSAKKEAQAAINVLDFFDITNPTVSTFNPKGNTTRGHFATFLNKSINTDFSLVSVGTGVVKAINTTTVEVTFKEAVSDINSLKFTIEGLEVKNAAVKQTDAKTVVLTTATQEGGKKYTVKSNTEEIGNFIGISAVIPEKVTMVTSSLQGILGKEVTVKADIGVKAAGVPVTLNITSDNATLNVPQVVEVFTNAEGIAEYSYTRYAASTDTVVAYATGDRTKFATGKVYWATAAKLTVTEVTEGNALANGSKKVYKIKTDSYETAYVGNSTTNVDYNYVNVTFNENLDVAPDKLVRGVDVIDTGLSTNANYPYQIKDGGGVNEVRVKVNAAGEATFTLNGSNGSVTPTVFVDADKNGKFGATELQATAATVKFDLSHTLKLAVKAEGVQNAAAINVANANNKGTGQGGRDYTVTLTDEKGVVAPAGTIAYVAFAEGSYSTDKAAYILDANDNRVKISKTTVQAIKVTGKEGKATFTLVGDRDSYAAPTVYLENGKEAGLDKADLQIVGETTYFVDAVVNNAALTVEDVNGKEVKTLPSSQTAFFHYNSVDQNGFDYFTGALGSYETSYQVTAHFADVTVSGTFGTKVVAKGTTETVKVLASNGKAVLKVTSENVASNVTVNASASQVSLPNKSATIEFTKGSQVPAVHTGNVESIDTIKNSLKFAGYDAITYSTSSFKNEAGVVISEARFETLVSDALAAKHEVKITSVRNADGTYTLEIEKIDTTGVIVPGGKISTAVLSQDGTELTLTFDKNVLASSIANTDFTVSAGSVSAVKSIAGDKVVLTVAGVAAANTVKVAAADDVTFTDGTSNTDVSVVNITQPVVTKVVSLTQTTPSALATAEVLANGKVTVGTNVLEIKGTTATEQAALNGLNFIVKQGAAEGATATYDSASRTISIVLGYNDAKNTATEIDAALASLGAHGAADFATLAATTTLTAADVATAKTFALADGVTAVGATVAGVYSFELKVQPKVGDSISLNGKTYVAGPDFVVASTLAGTTTNLVTAIKAKDTRFDVAGTTSSAGVVTLTEATATGFAAPSFSYSFK